MATAVQEAGGPSTGSLGVVGKKFKLIRKIGKGSFGEIYLGINLVSREEVAIKVEPKTAKNPQLLYEAKAYQRLQRGLGIPRIYWWGQEGDYNILVMQLLGPTLEDLFNYCGRKFSVKTVLMLVDQMLHRVELVHQKGFVHRDLKPDNFLMGIGRDANRLFLLDFGLSKEFRNSSTGHHVKYANNKRLTGTVRYASINAHNGSELSRRDDLETLGYILVYLLVGKLPWQNIKAETAAQKYDKIGDCKQTLTIETLSKGLPAEFGVYLTYCRNLRFEEHPDYNYLRALFRSLFRCLEYPYDNIFDWTILKQKAVQDISDAKKSHATGKADEANQLEKQ